MSEIINAVYENGVLRPTEPVSLSEGEKVRLEVIPETPVEEPQTEWEKALQLASDRGLIKLRPRNNKMDREELLRREKLLQERVKKMGPLPGKPLSQEIIEGRGPW
jgi:predicted DNA-binding antitoxin AbrB/MazE fold protein